MTPTITLIDTTRLKPNPNNPRKNIGDITALADSIRAHGIQQELVVTPIADSTDYRVVIGQPTTVGPSGGHAMRRQRLSPTMVETLIAMLNRNDYPAYENNSRTFASLEERGLIQPDIEGNWSLTDTGHQTALKLLKR